MSKIKKSFVKIIYFDFEKAGTGVSRVIGYRISDFGDERSHPEAKGKPNKPLFNRESSNIIRSIQK